VVVEVVEFMIMLIMEQVVVVLVVIELHFQEEQKLH
jgi:hypothetical protein